MMKKTAFLFPGQGSQHVGMGKAWREGSPLAAEVFLEADTLLGRSLSAICFDGPEEELKKTENTQPALYVCGVIGALALREAGVVPDVTAGHSLGEFTALAAAEAMDWREGLGLVQTRGQAMNAAAERNPGAMAAILGLEDDQVVAICEQAGGGVVAPANFNGPGQVVVSGDVAGVNAVVEACKAAGAKRAVLLPVHGAFHSPLMESAVTVLNEALAGVAFRDPRAAFVSTVTGERLDGAEAIRDNLSRQIISSVRWTQTMATLLAMGVELFVEVGPGKVLAGMIRRMDRNARCLSCAEPGDVAAIVEAYQE